MDIVQQIKKAAKENHITQKKMSLETGYDMSVISRWFNGKATPSVKAVEKLASAAGVEITVTREGVSMAKRVSKEDRTTDLYYEAAASLNLTRVMFNKLKLDIGALLPEKDFEDLEELEQFDKLVMKLIICLSSSMIDDFGNTEEIMETFVKGFSDKQVNESAKKQLITLLECVKRRVKK